MTTHRGRTAAIVATAVALAVAVATVTVPSTLSGGTSTADRAPTADGARPTNASSAVRVPGRVAGTAGAARPGDPVTASAATARHAASGTGSNLAAVPTGFVTQVDTVYGDLVATVDHLEAADPGQLAGMATLPSPTSVDQAVTGLDPVELGQLYHAVRRQRQWTTLVADVQQVASAIGSGSATTGAAGATGSATTGTATATGTSAPSAGAAGAGTAAGGSESADLAVPALSVPGLGTFGLGTSASSFPPAEPTGSFPPAPAPYQPSAPLTAVAPYTPTSCPSGAPGGPPDAPGDAAIFAAQLTTDVATNVAQDVPSTLLVVIAGEGTSIPDPAKYIAEAIALAGVITLDTLNYVQQVAADCDTANRDGFLANIDNTTVNVYDLLTLVQQTVDATENSVDTVSQQLDVLQQTMDDQLTLAIEQALSAPLSSVPNLAFELPASAGGNLDSTPIGVAEVVQAAVQTRLEAGAPVNAAAEQFLTMANAAVSAGQYTVAYADYHQAYLQAVGP
jgi:hypothetical protein